MGGRSASTGVQRGAEGQPAAVLLAADPSELEMESNNNSAAPAEMAGDHCRALTPYLADRCGKLLLSRGSAQVVTLGEVSIHLELETPKSAARLAPIGDSTVCGLEQMLLQSFVDDVYDDQSLKLLTATDLDSGSLAALVFWRDLPSVEVTEWLRSPRSNGNSRQLALKGTASDWAKVELLQTAPQFRGHGLGQLLLAAALAYSVVRQNKKSAVLQIAGGASNTPVSKLYQKFGFENVGGEVFGTPNENLMVLWNIENTLQNLNLQGEPRAGSKQINSASQAALPPAPNLSARELKTLLAKSQVGTAGCLEKQDLVDKAREHGLIE